MFRVEDDAGHRVRADDGGPPFHQGRVIEVARGRSFPDRIERTLRHSSNAPGRRPLLIICCHSEASSDRSGRGPHHHVQPAADLTLQSLDQDCAE